MRETPVFVFSQLHLPRPLALATVAGLFDQLVADRAGTPLVFEARADRAGLRHLLGCRQTDVHYLRRLLSDLLPGSLLTSATAQSSTPRPAMHTVRQLRMRPPDLPLVMDAIEATSRAMLSALAVTLHVDEAIVLQIVLGPRHAPATVSSHAPEPGGSLFAALTGGVRPASTSTRRRMQDRLGHHGVSAVVRLAARGDDAARRRRFITGVFSALATTQSPGLRIEHVSEPAAAVDEVRLPWRWPLRLTAAELLSWLAWPIGEGELPGMPPIHPKALPAAASIHSGERVFARSAVPGDTRLLGISAQDQTFHGVVYGPSGSGKTTAVLEHLVLADIEAGRPVAVLDPKHQFIDRLLARVPQHRVADVVELNAADPNPIGFNPLHVGARDPDVVVDGIMAVFEAVFTDGWGPRTQDIFSAGLRTLAKASHPQHPATLLDLPRLLTDAAFRRQQLGRVQGDLALDGFWAWYEAQKPSAQAAAIAAPMNKLRQVLLRPALARMLDRRGDAFRLRDLFQENKIVLVPLNEGLIGPGTAALLGSLVVAELWQATQERAADPQAGTSPATIYLDEAPRFLNLPVALADALAVSRSLGVGWFLAAQFRSQFPANLRTAVDMNARSKIQFATEYEDARDTARLTRDLMAEDFQALPRYHAYANLVADGHPSGWALVETLPPTPPRADPADVRAAARAAYAVTTPDLPEEPAAEADPPDPVTPSVVERIGRKRRQS